MTFVKIVFQDPLLPVHLHPEYFYPLNLGHPIFQDPPLKKKPNLFNKLLYNNRTVHLTKRNQNKSRTKSPHIQIDHAFYCSI